MKKSLLSFALMMAACSLPFTSCKDYDNEINDLQAQIDAINVSVGQMEELVKGGVKITSIEKTADGIRLVTDQGVYEINNNGGGSSVVWTIDSDGYWCKDGVRTEYRAIGQTGPQGPQGEPGAQGPQGATGNYYKPNPETGYFDLYDGATNKLIEATNISWKASSSTGGQGGVTAVFSGNKITFGNVEGAENGTVEIPIGVPVGSLVFIPSVYDTKLPYATTDDPFYYLPNYITDGGEAGKTYTAGTFQFIGQPWNASNVVAFEYRINPAGAYVPGSPNSSVEFINRQMTSRATGDYTNLLKQTGNLTVMNDELTVNARIYPMNLKGDNVVTARLWNGQDPVTSSDYVAVDANPISTYIYNTSATPLGTPYYTRNYALPTPAAETNSFIQSIVPLTGAVNLNVNYETGLDLEPYVALWCRELSETMKQAGFEGETFVFSLPDEYLAADEQNTNQQWFAQLDGSYLSVNSKNLTNGNTPAIGRTPVVRVDAYLPDNDGNVQMVASSYIKCEFTVTSTAEPEQPDKPTLEIPLPDNNFLYWNLTSTNTQIGQMLWQAVNNQIYGSQGLTSTNFWSNYMNEFTVTCDVATNDNGATKNIYTQTGIVGTPVNYTKDGIQSYVAFNSYNTETSQIEFNLNNLCKTNITYHNYQNKGAKFIITILLTPNDVKVNNPIKIVEEFYVNINEAPYVYNDNFLVPGTDNVNNPLPLNDGQTNANPSPNPAVIQTKGTDASSKDNTPGWVLEMDIAQSFQNEQVSGSWVDIFDYYYVTTQQAPVKRQNIVQASGINFSLYNTTATAIGADYGPATFGDHYVGLTTPLTTDKKDVPMKYEVDLVNGEVYGQNFIVEFLNPFMAGTVTPLTIYANDLGNLTADAAKSVVVVENGNANSVIYSYVNTALALSSRATDFFKLQPSQVTVEYAWNQTKGDWNAFANQLPEGSYLCDSNALNTGNNGTYGTYTPGTVVYYASAALQQNRTLYINATVKFGNICQVVVEIPVQFLAAVTPANKKGK